MKWMYCVLNLFHGAPHIQIPTGRCLSTLVKIELLVHAMLYRKCSVYGLAAGIKHPQLLEMFVQHTSAAGFKSILSDFPRPVPGHIPTVWAAALRVSLTHEMAKSSSQMSHLGTTKPFTIISKCKSGDLKGETSLKPFSKNQDYSLEDPSPSSKLHLTQYIDLGWIDESLSALISFIYISVSVKQLSHFGTQLCTLFMCLSVSFHSKILGLQENK